MIVAPVVLCPSFSFPAEDDASKFAKKGEESEKKKLQSVVRGDVLQCSSSSWLRHLSFQLYSYDDGKLGSRQFSFASS